MKQAHADKAKAEKKASDFMVKVQKEVQVCKLLKYKKGYKDRAQGKAPRNPLEVSVSRGDQSASRSLASDAPSPAAASATTTEVPKDPPAGVATEGPLAQPRSGAAEMSLQGSVST